MDFGDVLLAAMVFSDASGVKKRPVLVIHDAGDADILVVPVTSHPARTAEDVMIAEWQGQGAGLRLPSTARMGKLATIAKATVGRRLGALSAPDRQRAHKALGNFLLRIEP
jgi:mRNA-degrading endonuclease toxin of MazEF toxin-antitoxin module